MWMSRGELLIKNRILRRQVRTAKHWINEYEQAKNKAERALASALELLNLVAGNNPDIAAFIKANKGPTS